MENIPESLLRRGWLLSALSACVGLTAATILFFPLVIDLSVGSILSSQ